MSFSNKRDQRTIKSDTNRFQDNSKLKYTNTGPTRSLVQKDYRDYNSLH